jgi:hypothetical protein
MSSRPHFSVLIAALVFPALALAQQPALPDPAQGVPGAASPSAFLAEPGPDHLVASWLIGTRVDVADRENVGVVRDLVLTVDGKVTEAVVGYGGVLGLGRTYVKVPFAAVEFQPAEHDVTATAAVPPPTAAPAPEAGLPVVERGLFVRYRITVPMTRDEAKAAPTFGRNNR